jgi:hypothetical protein
VQAGGQQAEAAMAELANTMTPDQVMNQDTEPLDVGIGRGGNMFANFG